MGIVLIVYGLIVGSGAVLGIPAGQSRAPRIMSVFSGLMLAGSGVVVLLGHIRGAHFGIGVTGALILVFARQYLESLKMIPSGVLLAVSIIVAAFLYARLFT